MQVAAARGHDLRNRETASSASFLKTSAKADLEVFNLFVPYYDPDYGYLEIINNNDLKENRGYAPECNLYISISDNSTKYYSVDGEVYERRSDGEDEKLSTRNPEVYAHGNLW